MLERLTLRPRVRTVLAAQLALGEGLQPPEGVGRALKTMNFKGRAGPPNSPDAWAVMLAACALGPFDGEDPDNLDLHKMWMIQSAEHLKLPVDDQSHPAFPLAGAPLEAIYGGEAMDRAVWLQRLDIVRVKNDERQA